MNTGARPLDREARERLRTALRDVGFDAVRFARVTGAGGSALHDWLEAGHQADMAWMARTAAKRMDASSVLSGARTVIALGVNYWPGQQPEQSGPKWARYVLHEDYHDTIKVGLRKAGRVMEAMSGCADSDYRYYVDTGPVLERGWAARAGLGFRGKNTMLISSEHGNWLFLSAIITRLEIEPDQPLRPQVERPGGEEPAGLQCGKCVRCLAACPTGAFPRPGVVDSRLCISYQTIENKGVIPRELRAGIGNRIYGCDVCLEVCPWNRWAQAGRALLLTARTEIGVLTLGELLEMTPERFAEAFRRTAVKRLKLTGLLRNACVVAGNSGDVSHLPQLARLAAHESAVVRAHAVWAARKLAGTQAAKLLATAQAAETDPLVLAEYSD
jgi:epoxyqueuosine reductase